MSYAGCLKNRCNAVEETFSEAIKVESFQSATVLQTMKQILFIFYVVCFIFWSFAVLAGSWNVITSEEFEKKLSDKNQQKTETQQMGNVKIIRQKLPEITVHILFKPGSAEIADAFSKKQLDEVGKALSSEGLSKHSFEIAGHTDSSGSEKLNLKLSKQRATSIKDYLCMKYKILPEKLMARGYGESMPVAPNDTIAGRAKNRRVVIKRIK
jgi:outer membrane protein OmpA-like peptidoglycan-associated protein